MCDKQKRWEDALASRDGECERCGSTEKLNFMMKDRPTVINKDAEASDEVWQKGLKGSILLCIECTKGRMDVIRSGAR